MVRWFTRIEPTSDEIDAPRPGDECIADPDSIMNRAFTVAAPAAEVWPWIVQLGKKRAGWYLPRTVERFFPKSRRATRKVELKWQDLAVGDVVPDYGGPNETFTVHTIDAPNALVYTSVRGAIQVSWSIQLTPLDAGATRIHLRLRLGPIKRKWLVNTGGELIDLLTIAGLERGLAERLEEAGRSLLPHRNLPTGEVRPMLWRRALFEVKLPL